jgi:pimeloyl-ACP methyl ester carboxylesterase
MRLPASKLQFVLHYSQNVALVCPYHYWSTSVLQSACGLVRCLLLASYTSVSRQQHTTSMYTTSHVCCVHQHCATHSKAIIYSIIKTSVGKSLKATEHHQDAVIMSKWNASTESKGLLELADGRTLGYAENGNAKSRKVVLFFSGYFSVGSALSIPKPLEEVDVHWISPTLPGMGDSSTIKGEPYHVGLCRIVSALLDHFHPDGSIDTLYVGGGSYGSVPAQMIYGASYDLFPQGRSIAGLVVLSPFSPFKHHKDYHKSMTWLNWISVGPFSQWFPYRWVPRVISAALAPKLKDEASAKNMMHDFLVAKMDGNEKKLLEKWLQDRGLTQDQWLERLGQGAMRSTKTWDGFLQGSDVLHSDWGFEPSKLDEEHRGKPVLVVASNDDELGHAMYKWLKDNYANSALKVIPGSHISSMFHQDEIWGEMLYMA